MVKEVLLYTSINSESAERFINTLEENKGSDISLRLNTPGGEPEYGWGMVAKFSELPGKKIIKVDGKAYSMGSYFLAYADYSEALDVTEFLLHRAAYPNWFENSDYMTDAMWENLNRINSSLRKALEAKIDVEKLESIKGITMDDLFSNEKRVDVFLSAKEAKKIGLINKINVITPDKKEEINSLMVKVAAEFGGIEIPKVVEKPKDNKIESQSNNKIMTIESLKADHPALYNQLIELGVKKERERAGAWLEFHDIDPEAVKKGINEGSDLNQKSMAEFTRKAISAQTLQTIKTDNPKDVTTTEVKPQGSAAAAQDETPEMVQFKAELEAKRKERKF